MDYTLIIIVTIVVTTLFVHQLANRAFGIRLSMKPLALCALFSVCISLILPRVIVGFAGLAGTIGVLAVCAIVFAYFVVCYEETIEAKMSAASEQTLMSSFSRLNTETAGGETTSIEGNAAYEGRSVCEQTLGDFDPLENQKAVLFSSADEIVVLSSADEVTIEHQPTELLQTDIPELEAANFSTDDSELINPIIIANDDGDGQLDKDELSESTAVLVSIDELAIEHQPIELLQPDIPESESANFVADDAEFSSPTIITDEDSDRKLVEDELAESTTVLVSTDELAIEHQPIELLQLDIPELEADNFIADDTEFISPTIITDEDCDNSLEVVYVSETTNTGIINLHDNQQSNINMTEVIDSVEKCGFSFLDDKSLDELLDYAFQQQEEKNFDHALFAFKNILKQFPSSTVAPFAVIEIGNLLKTRGAYDEAIQVFADAKNLPALQTKNQFEKEFVNAIAHLRIIKNTLIHRRLGLLPFHEIPAAVCEEIDTEFREWLKLTQI